MINHNKQLHTYHHQGSYVIPTVAPTKRERLGDDEKIGSPLVQTPRLMVSDDSVQENTPSSPCGGKGVSSDLVQEYSLIKIQQEKRGTEVPLINQAVSSCLTVALATAFSNLPSYRAISSLRIGPIDLMALSSFFSEMIDSAATRISSADI